MKLKKSDFKQLIKECLMEILVEGFGNELSVVAEAYSHKKSNGASPRLKQKKRMPRRSQVEAQQVVPEPLMENVKLLSDDPIMASIFVDTAKTTLQEQRGGTPLVTAQNSDNATMLAAQLDPVELEGSSKWADLAFSTPGNK
jgi:hypothetical protein